MTFQLNAIPSMSVPQVCAFRKKYTAMESQRLNTLDTYDAIFICKLSTVLSNRCFATAFSPMQRTSIAAPSAMSDTRRTPDFCFREPVRLLGITHCKCAGSISSHNRFNFEANCAESFAALALILLAVRPTFAANLSPWRLHDGSVDTLVPFPGGYSAGPDYSTTTREGLIRAH
jgi:hypothetical protein